MSNIKKLMENIPECIDGGIINSAVNRYYFTGYKSSAGTLVVTRDKSYFIIDFRYFEKAKKIVKDCDVILQDKLNEQIKDILNRHNIRSLGVENYNISLNQYNIFKNNFEDINIVNSSEFNDIINKLRMIKSEQEIENIRKAQSITDKAFDYILNFISEDKTEKQVALELEYFMKKNGADDIAFDIIAVSGKNSSLPHGTPSNKKLEKGDTITLDFGAKYLGYHSDMTRSIFLGEASDYQQEIYNTVLKAQTESLKEIKPGIICNKIDKIARDIISEAGYGKNFGHSLGHGVGLEIHEQPAFSSSSNTILEKGMVLTVEPGIYIEDKFGVRIEDMVLITDNGYENLTKSSKKIICL